MNTIDYDFIISVDGYEEAEDIDIQECLDTMKESVDLMAAGVVACRAFISYAEHRLGINNIAKSEKSTLKNAFDAVQQILDELA